MECGVPKWIEQVLIAGAIALFLATAVGIILRALFEIVIIFELAEGDLTWGDIFTLMSIIAAGIIACIGWFLTRQHRRKEIERLAEAERREIERLAKAEWAEAKRMALADATIMYERLNPLHMTVIFFLYTLVPPAGSGLVIDFPDSISPEDAAKNYISLEVEIRKVKKLIPDTDDFYKSLHSLYLYRAPLGKKYVAMLLCLLGLKIDVDGYLDLSHEENLGRFNAKPNTEKRRFFELLIGVVSFLIEMDSCRRELEGPRFFLPSMKRSLMELKNRLDNLRGIDGNEENKLSVLTQASYLKMLIDAERYFVGRSNEFFDRISSDSS